MKNLITRIAVTMGAVALTPAAAIAQETGSYSAQEVCTNPALSELSQKLWDYVTKQDKLEIYVAYLEVCGNSALTADFATQAREIVIKNTANYMNLPNQTFAFSPISETRINAFYVG